MKYVNGWTGPSTKNGKDFEYSRLVNWEAMIKMDSANANMAWNTNLNISDATRAAYIDKEIKQNKDYREKYVDCVIRTIEKMLIFDNGLVKYAFFDSNGDIITFRVDCDGLFGTEPENPAAALGRKGGMAKTAAKQSTARENGKKGGRPRKTQSEIIKQKSTLSLQKENYGTIEGDSLGFSGAVRIVKINNRYYTVYGRMFAVAGKNVQYKDALNMRQYKFTNWNDLQGIYLDKK